MLNKYREDIISRVLKLLNWEECDEIRSIHFVCNNKKKISSLSGNEFYHYRIYVKFALFMFIYHEEYEDEDGKWSEIADLFFSIQDCEQQEFSDRYFNTASRLERQMEWLPQYTLELAKFFEVYHQHFWRQYYLSRKLEKYDERQLYDDYLHNVNIQQKIKLMLRAYENRKLSNPLMFVDNKTLPLGDEYVSYRLACNSTFDKLNKHNIPFTDDFIKEIKITSREIMFQMFVDMIECVSNKSNDLENQQLENLIWSKRPPTDTLFNYTCQHSEEFASTIRNGNYDWKSILFILNSDTDKSDIDEDIYLTRDEEDKNKEYIIVPPSKLSHQYSADKMNNKELYLCLKKLYDKLYEQNVFEGPCEKAFIYRLSGFEKPDDLHIKWVGKHLYLGRIVRALYSVKGSSPNYKGFETFFDLKDKNIANASKQLTGPNGKHNLRMVVKLLEECGFVDVNVFEELQPIKQEKNVS